MKTVVRASLAVLALSLGLITPVFADQLDDAIAEYKREDYATALRLYRPLAEQGHPRAQYGLGVMHYTGQGVPQDYAEAVKWHRKATEQGVELAQYNLGIMYYKGKDVPQDYVQAHMWFNLAVANREDNGQREIAAKYCEDMAKEMTEEQIAEAWKLAREWKPSKVP